jgi:preprotein translocase subunit SecD
MNFYAGRFNLYLLALLVLALAGGCATSKKSKDDKALGAVRVHVESTANAVGGGQTISVLRVEPVAVTIAKEPVLTEANLVHARLIETPGGFGLELKFDETGSWTLEQYSAAYGGKHFAIFGQWSDDVKDGRWLAAPLITGRNATGTLTFTPDMSHEEAAKLVAALNRAAKKAQTGKE